MWTWVFGIGFVVAALVAAVAVRQWIRYRRKILELYDRDGDLARELGITISGGIVIL